jgi:hypothetical protein
MKTKKQSVAVVPAMNRAGRCAGRHPPLNLPAAERFARAKERHLLMKQSLGIPTTALLAGLLGISSLIAASPSPITRENHTGGCDTTCVG